MLKFALALKGDQVVRFERSDVRVPSMVIMQEYRVEGEEDAQGYFVPTQEICIVGEQNIRDLIDGAKKLLGGSENGHKNNGTN